MDAIRLEKIRDSFVVALMEPARAGRLFYDHLFRIAPQAREMFSGDMEAQSRVLIATLATVLTGLDRPKTMTPVLESLAIRHVDYGVIPAHYGLVRDALLAMLAEMTGADLEQDVIDGWDEAYTFVASTMIAAAYPNEINPFSSPR